MSLLNQNKKIFLAVIISVLLTFFITSVFYLGMGGLDFLYQNGLSVTPSEPPALLKSVKKYLDAYYLEEYDEQTLYEGAAKGMVEAVGDDYTKYYTADEFEAYMQDTTGEFVGVGMVISIVDGIDGIVVVAPYEGSPAEKAGMLPGDVIKAVDGEKVSSDMLDETSKLLRGVHLEKAEGTEVTVTFERNGETFDAVLTRQQINVTSASGNIMEQDKSVGYIRINSFDADTDAEFMTIYAELKNQGAKKFILDLRDNPGGDFYTCCRLAGKFLEKDSVVTYLEDKSGRREYEYAAGKEIDEDFVILINGNSASASEVFTGAIRDHNRAKAIVGTTSYGKGITQSIFMLGKYGGMSITSNRYYTPAGECIHEKGITPDTVVELDDELTAQLSYRLDYEDDIQLQKALEILESQ